VDQSIDIFSDVRSWEIAKSEATARHMRMGQLASMTDETVEVREMLISAVPQEDHSGTAGCLRVTPQGMIQFVDPLLAKALGYSAEDLNGQPVKKLFGRNNKRVGMNGNLVELITGKLPFCAISR
jgi:PAS domain-containing protein